LYLRKETFARLTEVHAGRPRHKLNKRDKIINKKNKTKILDTCDWGIRSLSLPHQTSDDPESYPGIPYRRASLCEIPA